MISSEKPAVTSYTTFEKSAVESRSSSLSVIKMSCGNDSQSTSLRSEKLTSRALATWRSWMCARASWALPGLL